MRLTDLNPVFLKIVDERTYKIIEHLSDADGIEMLCPRCFETNGGPRGTHSLICWRPRVPQSFYPVPGRWELVGTSLGDLSLVAGSSSVKIEGGCNAHFYVQNGEVTFA